MTPEQKIQQIYEEEQRQVWKKMQRIMAESTERCRLRVALILKNEKETA